MIERVIVHRGRYHDSAQLMRLTGKLKELDGVADAEVLMGTEMNRELLAAAGFGDPALDEAMPMDLVVAVRAETEDALEAAVQELSRLLEAKPEQRAGAPRKAGDLGEALGEHPEANLVTVAVPGAYAAYVARKALDAGRHVFLFSDNVTLDDEVALKKYARDQGLLMMGPDCGTAILAGVGLGFANRVRPGRIGLVGASGTGIQEITSLIHQAGEGISQAIGTGGHDLSAEVGGVMTELGLELLAGDAATAVMVIVAKQPAEAVAERLHGVLARAGKPVVVRYLGQGAAETRDGVLYASSLDEAAQGAVALLAGDGPVSSTLGPELPDAVRDALGALEMVDGRLVGLFGGGSLASEAALTLRQAGLRVEVPDCPLSEAAPLPGTAHLVVDTGDDFYTVGRPHPMVDQTVRCELVRAVGADPGVGVLLLDLVLGDGAHPDPAPELAEAVQAARDVRGDRPLLAIASVTGTDLDPQNAARQRRVLTEAGVLVQPSAARAAQLAAALLSGAGERSQG